MAEPKNLSDLLYETLMDMYFAEKRILTALPEMAEAAQSPDLKEAFETHLGQSEDHVARLEQAFELIGKPAQPKTCNAILGIIEDGKEVMEAFKGTAALDPGLLAAAQAVEHYEISRYGTMVTWAETLGLDDVADLLAETLDEEETTDERLTEIAKATVNAQAA
ncbi:ferritin-like domain-containing protein [Rhizobium mongolense]|uniref:Ferritin-like protein n=1 Tax=Rhizobium gallicum TaxID=56730 RepID=A0A1L5NL14_9HYPH|nr:MULTISPECIES: ferritin-like domain-containing protein [Rhizobium]APO68574.1 ferritin-like protein [Rhizobium gallicum]QPB18483.1 ferritin-like domain-containing protein [Rhizobium sp. 007]ULJ72564.1 ferritin-like domain-containing protein [Rhizobium gallicum]